MIEHALALCAVYLFDNRFVNASSPLYFIALVLPSKQISRLTRKVAPVQLPATIGYGCPFGLNSARFLFDFFVFSVITSDADFDPTFAIHNVEMKHRVPTFSIPYPVEGLSSIRDFHKRRCLSTTFEMSDGKYLGQSSVN